MLQLKKSEGDRRSKERVSRSRSRSMSRSRRSRSRSRSRDKKPRSRSRSKSTSRSRSREAPTALPTTDAVLIQNAVRACEILNRKVNFNDFKNVSAFLYTGVNVPGYIHVRGPSKYRRRRRKDTPDPDQRPMLTDVDFVNRMLPYIERSSMIFEGHKSGTYFIITEKGVDHILNSWAISQILPDESKIHHRRATNGKGGFNKILKNPFFDKSIFKHINKFLP